tara:strand:- start:295 stop:450 length:156 start_codon:yes stop_codon:yes gene_type:complete
MKFAEDAKAGRLILPHHHPDHDDVFLQNLENHCQLEFNKTVLAREGMIIEL